MGEVWSNCGQMLTARLLEPAEDGRLLLELYAAYTAELARIGPAGFDRNNPWWEKPEQCCTVVSATPCELAGFLMVGYGEQVDTDVASEICEAYVVPRWRGRGTLRRMLDAAAPLLRDPWSFQVLAGNWRMWRCVECWLRRRAIDFAVRETIEDGVPVRKYRPVGSR